MIRETGNIEFSNGFIFRFWSDKCGKSFYVVQYNDWGYVNIFDENKEREAVNSLLDKDVSCQERDGNLPINLMSEEEEELFKEYCRFLEENEFNYDEAEELFFANY